MENENRKTFSKIFLPAIVLALGIVLLVLNIIVESEPGALPLLIVLISGGWLLVQRLRARKNPGKSV